MLDFIRTLVFALAARLGIRLAEKATYSVVVLHWESSSFYDFTHLIDKFVLHSTWYFGLAYFKDPKVRLLFFESLISIYADFTMFSVLYYDKEVVIPQLKIGFVLKIPIFWLN